MAGNFLYDELEGFGAKVDKFDQLSSYAYYEGLFKSSNFISGIYKTVDNKTQQHRTFAEKTSKFSVNFQPIDGLFQVPGEIEGEFAQDKQWIRCLSLEQVQVLQGGYTEIINTHRKLTIIIDDEYRTIYT